ncbi:MAG: (E)-4-hydroxy-3-methylbut-2-enyl-diphosphate synthase [Bacteroidetes bacterium]|nr:(E)-4-hydroxy-3-methylbut-2-enyl-diphosphate synthase [Bacteroidota bacterium]
MFQFTENPYSCQRFFSREVKIGNTALGGSNPIRIQSMCNTATMDTLATVEQSIRMIEAGCEYVRITAPGIKEAEHLAVIKNELYIRGFTTPLIADIHFNPKAAEVAAAIVEKVRINPGNYVDRNTDKFEFSEEEYRDELQRIAERLFPLIEICKKNQTALRLGSNHGSLSNRILNRYGDTPKGMVESAMEFIRICEQFDFRNLVLSMKSSNVKVMIASTRLLVATMKEEGMNYPIHLGVTEAGDAEDGRIKSAGGIGALLEDGIGDTIRVSLTEEPELEIPVARKIIDYYKNREIKEETEVQQTEYPVDPYRYARRTSQCIDNIGGFMPVAVFAKDAGGKADYSIGGNKIKNNGTMQEFELISAWNQPDEIKNDENIRFIILTNPQSLDFKDNALKESLKNQKNLIFITAFEGEGIKNHRLFFAQLLKANIQMPVIVKRTYHCQDKECFQIQAAADYSALLHDGFCDGIWLENPNFSDEEITATSFAILQASGVRITRTEFIACPSCGRTQFNIQAALKSIKERTSHLKGLKIAVMGCIVNGPGEMADAHYGYVGAGAAKISLYKGKNLVEKNIPETEAIEKLIGLIKQNGDWKEIAEV